MKSLCILILSLFATCAVIFADTLQFVPGQVIVSFKDKSREILRESDSGVQCVYPNLQGFLQSEGAKKIYTVLYGSATVGGLYLIGII